MTAPVAAPRGRVVVGADGSPHAASALRWALRQAALTGAAVEAVACWQRPVVSAGFGVYVDIDVETPLREALDRAVAEALADTPQAAAVPLLSRVVEGHPAWVLVESAAGADLLVVGSRGHGAMSGLLLGSVGLHCATHARCPVLIVPDLKHPGGR